jgi:hypothetical protein
MRNLTKKSLSDCFRNMESNSMSTIWINRHFRSPVDRRLLTLLFGEAKHFDNFDFAQQPSSVTNAIANSRSPAGKLHLLIAAPGP